MSEEKHTKGPWTVQRMLDHTPVIVSRNPPQEVATINMIFTAYSEIGSEPDDITMEANAELIAAAPRTKRERDLLVKLLRRWRLAYPATLEQIKQDTDDILDSPEARVILSELDAAASAECEEQDNG